MATLEYYFAGGCHVVFDKYTMDPSCNIIHNKSGKILSIHRDGGYNVCSVQDNYGKKRKIRLSRAIASTLLGPPPSSEHTADHIHIMILLKISSGSVSQDKQIIKLDQRV